MICENDFPPIAIGAETMKRGINCPTNSVTSFTRLSFFSSMATLSVTLAVCFMLEPLGLYISTINWSRSAFGIIWIEIRVNSTTPATTTAAHTPMHTHGWRKHCDNIFS